MDMGDCNSKKMTKSSQFITSYCSHFNNAKDLKSKEISYKNSSRTSPTTIHKIASPVSVNIKHDGNGVNALTFFRNGEYVKQRPNKLVRADLFKDQKGTRLNGSIVMANGSNRVFKSQIVNKQCTYFNKYGRCKDGDLCSYKHNPNKVEICKKWLKGAECSGKKCYRQHILSAHIIPHCSHFAKGMCLKGSECRYTHVKVSKRADYCKEFMVDGFCDAGENCRKKHEWANI
ncbi:uncharacterized protein OCT59_025101 [Rhizophagus irregularis]|uniref:Yth1p n=4 Tax=Rhizophagus irregularis TaxID=588596 RepID=A0A015MS36_RHIIW|nr:hypothetical protein GLOIN_2v1597149 [Rhizophagus irregularis DAOM 181602=DAOM 197198]EXX69548.1 Yth1p [Rhizophagus irregularis DAOM 197198w]POG72414.1 hypothetical protein GLOIN_2v1597149 [Rhizophagus irregularis DAOM 181602=DAOM 197198]UZO04730.1 hypothetical protein OCT59_025101 [Rhizophagus irregularis]|eukprot:XP_025179280.1 hypothetical protein GLOIN_2v1597149 [Rhizophagus irregularis DAOM 181602=DAOM 197198]